MNKITATVALSAAFLCCACQSSDVKISGRFVGNSPRKVYLEQVSSLKQTLIDSAEVDNQGNYSFQIAEAEPTPALYNLVYNAERIPMLIAKGDNLQVNAVGNLTRNYTVENSRETELLREFYQPFVLGAQNLRKIADQYADTSMSAERHEALGKEYAREYYRIRREQLRFIITHKQSLAAVYALYQRLPGDRHLFNGDSDVIYFREVAEALKQTYPTSPYLRSLEAEIKRMDARIELQNKVTEAGFPDLELNDMFGKPIRLSSLKGKVILLDFWSAELGTSNALNAELKEIYAKYHEAATPLEVYQVAIDTSKPLWISAVQDQQLPWISVSDLQGGRSSALGIYNVQNLPANFLIDKAGDVVAKNLYGRLLEQKIEELTR